MWQQQISLTWFRPKSHCPGAGFSATEISDNPFLFIVVHNIGTVLPPASYPQQFLEVHHRKDLHLIGSQLHVGWDGPTRPNNLQERERDQEPRGLGLPSAMVSLLSLS